MVEGDGELVMGSPKASERQVAKAESRTAGPGCVRSPSRPLASRDIRAIKSQAVHWRRPRRWLSCSSWVIRVLKESVRVTITPNASATSLMNNSMHLLDNS